jgi:hypothetical protein
MFMQFSCRMGNALAKREKARALPGAGGEGVREALRCSWQTDRGQSDGPPAQPASFGKRAVGPYAFYFL